MMLLRIPQHTGVSPGIFISKKCPASFCQQKAPSVKQQSVLLFSSEVLKTVDQVQPCVPSAVFKDKDKAHAATTFFIHTLIHASIKMFQEDDLILHPACLFHDDCRQ